MDAKEKTAECPYCFYQSPVGMLRIEEDEKGITGIRFADHETVLQDDVKNSIFLQRAVKQLDEYFSGKRGSFDLPLSMRGTEFQLKVWRQLREIPYGETRSYQDLGLSIGNPKAARAVGMANNRNPIPIIIPCHRVIGKDKRLVGYAGGIERKRFLLDLEAANK